jgi:hypothetical protein
MSKYNVTKDINSESRQNNFMGPGIHENVELKHLDPETYPIVYGESKKGNKFAAFHFINEKGEVLIHTEYEPSDPDQEKLENKTLNQIKRFKHIITKFIPEDDFIFESENFEDFVKKSIQILGNKYVGKKVRVKVTLNNNDFTSLPNYVPFIELMSTEKSKLSINTAMDKMVKGKADVETSNNTNPFAGTVEEDTIQATMNSDNTMNDVENMPF